MSVYLPLAKEFEPVNQLKVIPILARVKIEQKPLQGRFQHFKLREQFKRINLVSKAHLNRGDYFGSISLTCLLTEIIEPAKPINTDVANITSSVLKSTPVRLNCF